MEILILAYQICINTELSKVRIIGNYLDYSSTTVQFCVDKKAECLANSKKKEDIRTCLKD